MGGESLVDGSFYLKSFPEQDHHSHSRGAETFINEIADRYYRSVVEELRKHDPHHLILGNHLSVD